MDFIRTKPGIVLMVCLLASWAPADLPAQEASPDVPYDLVLTGGTVIDPANAIHGRKDVAVRDGRIAAVADRLPAGGALRTVDVSGLYVAPGFIDIHAHAHPGRTPGKPSFPPDLYFASGTTTIVDAGTWGAKDFHVFKQTVVNRSQVRVLAFLNIVAAGMAARAAESWEQDVTQMDARLCASVVEQNRDILVGIKTAHYWTSKPFDDAHPPWASVDRAVEAGRLANVPVMVDFWPRPPERSYAELILERLRPGDIHTHVFAQQFPIVDTGGNILEHMLQARRRGIIFDLGHGAGSFWFRNAAPAIDKGFIPDTISTDLHSGNFNGPVLDMVTTMSKIMALGVPLEDVIRRSTVNPAKVIRRPELGTLTVGREADIAVFAVRHGRFGYTDCGRAKIVGQVKIENRMTLRAGRIVFDPTGVSAVEWRQAAAPYFTVPGRQGVDSPATADPDVAARSHTTDRAGHTPNRIAAIDERMREFVRQGEITGAVTLVMRRGRVLHLGAVGHADVEKHHSMRTDSIFGIASMTKPITATALMILHEEGKLALDDPVSRFIPSFKDTRLADGRPSRPVTIRHLLTHTSGLGGSQAIEGSLERTAQVLGQRPLNGEPGTRWQYSPGLNVCGRIIEVISGQAYDEFLTRRIFGPLRMVDTTFNPSPHQRRRLATLVKPGATEGTVAEASHWLSNLSGPRAPNPSGGLFSTAADLVRFYQMILNGGELDGRRIVSKATVDQMVGLATGDLKTGFTPGNGWGLGWCIVRQPQGVSGMLSPGTYGHGGAFGTQGWVDPQREMIFVLMIQRTGFGNSDASAIREAFQDLAVAAARD